MIFELTPISRAFLLSLEPSGVDRRFLPRIFCGERFGVRPRPGDGIPPLPEAAMPVLENVE
ncbi:hypothetical protein CP49_29725 [Bradyrhizobium valentinum]|uniref:Uncharacterized protein n=1 Tax=Bradyrhizobium valentinum TaxID=1518501 RepID=A0A0R3LMU4_9BRAD|nr:hypothetical protein CP49_29725 [Bradyrhizobium valentinum]